MSPLRQDIYMLTTGPSNSPVYMTPHAGWVRNLPRVQGKRPCFHWYSTLFSRPPRPHRPQDAHRNRRWPARRPLRQRDEYDANRTKTVVVILTDEGCVWVAVIAYEPV